MVDLASGALVEGDHNGVDFSMAAAGKIVDCQLCGDAGELVPVQILRQVAAIDCYGLLILRAGFGSAGLESGSAYPSSQGKFL